MLRGNRAYFEKAGIDIDYYVEHGWDYRTFRDALRKVQDVARREKGPAAYGFGLQPAQMTTLLYQNLLPNVIGKDATERDMLLYDRAHKRYILDPPITPEKLAQPLELMQQLMGVDKTWSEKVWVWISPNRGTTVTIWVLPPLYGRILPEVSPRRSLVR
jgi:hypothetical protein